MNFCNIKPGMMNYNNPPNSYYYPDQQNYIYPPVGQQQMQLLQQQVVHGGQNGQQNPQSQPNGPPGSNRRGPWSPLEDKKLLDLIGIFGPTNWVRISNSLATRTPKQCRERYHQNLKPSLNRSPITFEEGELIESLVGKYGKKWAEISRHLNGRSDNAIKNWWNGGANRRRRASVTNTAETPELPASSNSSGPSSYYKPNVAANSSTSLVDLKDEDSKTASESGYPASAPPTTATNPAVNIPLPNFSLGSAADLSHTTSANPVPSTVNPVSSAAVRTTTNTFPSNVPSNAFQSSRPSQYPQVPHISQISFNTSMFGQAEKTNAGNSSLVLAIPPINKPVTPPSENVGSHTPPYKSSSSSASSAFIPSRSSSFDTNSTMGSILPPISSSNKRRLLEEPISRRHSTASHNNAPPNASQNYNHHYHHHPHLFTSSHPNLTSTFSGQQPGNLSPSYGSPLLLSTQGSRNNSISHFEFSTLSSSIATNSSSRRSSSIASDLFPNPLKELQPQGLGANTPSHKRNISQNSFNSPQLVPTSRFSVSSTTSIFNSNYRPQSSHTSPTNLVSNKSSSSLNNVVMEEEQELKKKSPLIETLRNAPSDTSGETTKISVSSLID